MIRITILALTLTATSVAAQDGLIPQVRAGTDTEAAEAAKEGAITGFVPLIAPALGALAATAGIAAAVGGGATPSTTSTTSTTN